MSYDPAWDMPQLNWQQQGSYEGGSIPPITEPDAGTQVYLGPVAREWLQWVCGALDQLRNPSAWIVADDDAMYNTLRRVDTLLGLICGNGGNASPVLTRLENCVLQTSVDGGVTWTDVPGWADNFGACVRQNLPPPIPPNPGDDIIDQHACNLAGYLAHEVIQYAMTQMVAGITGMDPPLVTIRAILDFIPGAPLVLDDLTTAMSDLYNTITGGTLAHYAAASTDATLWAGMTCAIFGAIKSVGYVSAANFAAVGIAILGLSYTYPEVVSAVGFYWAKMGLTGAQAVQTVGAIDDVDCSACGEWCYKFDFTAGDQGASVFPGYGGSYTAGIGWQSESRGGLQEVYIFLPFPSSQELKDITVQFCTPSASGGSNRSVQGRLAGVNTATYFDLDAAAVPACITSGGHALADTMDGILICIRQPDSTPQITIQSVEVGGYTAINPWGADNCTYPVD
jgi:hypothetical protein